MHAIQDRDLKVKRMKSNYIFPTMLMNTPWCL